MIPTKVTVLVKNGSVHLVHEGPPSPNVPCAFLILVLVLGLSLNACVFLSLAFASPRPSSFNLLLACFSFVVALEDVFNVTSSIAFRSAWEELYNVHGEASVRLFCALNATCLQFVAVCQLCLLAVISYERWTSLKITGNGGGLKLKMAVPLVVVVSGVAALPIGLLATRLIEQRYSCSPVYVSLQPTQIVTASLTILIGYCLPPSIIFNSWLTITKEIQKERRRIHSLELSPSPPVSFLHPEDAETRTKLPPYTLAALLIIFYFVLVAPNIILVQATQFYSSYHVRREQYLLFGMYKTNKTELPEELYPIDTDAFDAVCIWARYSFTVVSPLLIIKMNEEVRNQCRKGCRAFREGVERQKKRNDWRTLPTTADWTTPVLFATAEGLHLRKMEVPGATEAFLPARLSIEFCDLFLEKLPQREEARNPPPRVVRENSVEEVRKAGPSRQSHKRVPSGAENQSKFLEPKNESLDESSSSLLLTLHQRMRKRDY